MIDTVKNIEPGGVILPAGPKEMRGQSGAFAFSVGIHLVVLILAFGVMRGTPPESKPLIIDFSLGDRMDVKQSAQHVRRRDTKSETLTIPRPLPLPAKISEQQVLPEKNAVIQPAPQAQLMTGKEEARVTAATPEPAHGSAPDPVAGVPGHGDSHGAAGATSFSKPGNETEKPEMRYVKAHFASIRNAIVSKLSYPRLARRRGWAGTVKVSFIVNEDGGVSTVKILSTSGYELLDHNAVETINRGSPYPKPPCRAEIVMPITFRLDE